MSTAKKATIQYMDVDGSFHPDKAGVGPSIKHLCLSLASRDRKNLENVIAEVLCVSPAGKTDQAPDWFRANKLKEARSILVRLEKLANE